MMIRSHVAPALNEIWVSISCDETISIVVYPMLQDEDRTKYDGNSEQIFAFLSSKSQEFTSRNQKWPHCWYYHQRPSAHSWLDGYNVRPPSIVYAVSLMNQY